MTAQQRRCAGDAEDGRFCADAVDQKLGVLCGYFSRLNDWKNAMSARPDRYLWAKGFIAHFSGAMMYALIFRVSLATRAQGRGREYGCERATG
jgi:hypothetical protein